MVKCAFVGASAIWLMSLAAGPLAAQSGCNTTCVQTQSAGLAAITYAAFGNGGLQIWFQTQGSTSVFGEYSAAYVVSDDNAKHQCYSLSVAPSVPGLFWITCGRAASDSVKYKLFWPANSAVDISPFFPGQPPFIGQSGPVNGASFSPGIVPGSWVTIMGANLSSATDTWDKTIVNGQLPTTLDGVGVSIGGRQAFVYYVSPGQINAQVPDVSLGPALVTVTNASGTSAAFTAAVQQFAPAFFLWSGKYAVATHQDFSLAAKAGLFSGVTTVPAKPGDVIILWGTGFGPTIPAVAAGIQVPADTTHSTATPVTVTVGGTDAQVYGTALAPGYAGLYQVAIQIPSSTPDGDIPIKASIGGVQSPDSVFITVQH